MDLYAVRKMCKPPSGKLGTVPNYDIRIFIIWIIFLQINFSIQTSEILNDLRRDVATHAVGVPQQDDEDAVWDLIWITASPLSIQFPFINNQNMQITQYYNSTVKLLRRFY